MIICTTGAPGPEHTNDGMKILNGSGFKNIMVGMGAFKHQDEKECLRSEEPRMLTLFADTGYKIPIVSGASYSTDKVEAKILKNKRKNVKPGETAPKKLSPEERHPIVAKGNEMLLGYGIESIEFAEKAGAQYMLVPQLIWEEDEVKEVWEANNSKYLLELAKHCENNGICLLVGGRLENVGGHLVRGRLCDADDAASFIESLNAQVGAERFGYCMDVAMCSICGLDMQAFARTLDTHLKAVILGDCDGHNMAHYLPFTAGQSTEWLSLIRGLRDIEFDGLLIMDAGSTLVSFPLSLHKQLAALSKSVADYFEWQITLERNLKKYRRVVLFGAGQMCEHYMYCHGEEYPPLYTCDNNKNLWGSMVCGLEVKSPDELLKLPDDCGVVICNIYYDEIGEQLRKMGIKNVISYNDEYMKLIPFEEKDDEDENGEEE